MPDKLFEQDTVLSWGEQTRREIR